LYTDGDRQNWHTDSSHGPLAYVFHLSSPQLDDYIGGETMFLRPNILSFWHGESSSACRKAMELGDIQRLVPPKLGECIVFDPRIPHGVNPVVQPRGKDPRHGRVAIHGWFQEPQMVWSGEWEQEDQSKLETELESIVSALVEGKDVGCVLGYLAVRVLVDSDGSIQEVTSVCDTLQADMDDYRGIIGYDPSGNPVTEDAPADVKLTLLEALQELEFQPGGPDRSVVIPFLFE